MENSEGFVIPTKEGTRRLRIEAVSDRKIVTEKGRIVK
jgi:hypothetical protein